MTKKVKFIEVETNKEVYIDLPVATEEGRASYKCLYITEILRILKNNNKISSQQYRSERGKLLHNKYNTNEALNFIYNFKKYDDLWKRIDVYINKIKDVDNKEFVKCGGKYMEIKNVNGK